MALKGVAISTRVVRGMAKQADATVRFWDFGLVPAKAFSSVASFFELATTGGLDGNACWRDHPHGGRVRLRARVSIRAIAPRRVVVLFATRIGLPLDEDVVDAVDRRIWHRLIGLSIGGLVVLVGFAFLLIWPQLIPTGAAGFAVGGILWAAMAIGGAVTALEQFAPPAPGRSRFARAKTPGLTDDGAPRLGVDSRSNSDGDRGHPHRRTASRSAPGVADGGLPLPGLVGLTIIALLGALLAALLSRRLLEVAPPVGGELGLQWDDALRAYALRDLWFASIALSAAASAVCYSWIFDATPLEFYIGATIALLPVLLFALPPSKRSQRRLWSPVSG